MENSERSSSTNTIEIDTRLLSDEKLDCDDNDEEPIRFERRWENCIRNYVFTSNSGNYCTPHGLKKTISDEESRKQSNQDDCTEACAHRIRETPLPIFLWADSKIIWDIMMNKADAAARNRNSRLFENTETILPRMRAILVEWIMEVCEVYRLRRSTFYLALDYTDRYLSINTKVPKNQLQLLGVTALYIASKFEEVYSPKVGEFAYVCDGACDENDIILCETLLLNALSWDINPMTTTCWLNLYMQIHFDNKTALNRGVIVESEASEYFMYARYSAFDFVKASHLIDLLALDPGYLLFNYNTMAASAMYFLYGRGCALRVSGLEWKDIDSCVDYMAVFYSVIRSAEDPKLDYIPTHAPIDSRDWATYNFLKSRIPDLIYGENHTMQTRCITLDYLERATILRMQRMGYRINKTSVQLESPDMNNEETSVKQESVTEKQEHIVYEVERDPNLIASSQSENSDISELTESSQNDIYGEYFDYKLQFTFDEILEGVHECTIKRMLNLNEFMEEPHKNIEEVDG